MLGLVAPVLLLLRIRVLVGAVLLELLELPLVVRLVDLVDDVVEVSYSGRGSFFWYGNGLSGSYLLMWPFQA